MVTADLADVGRGASSVWWGKESCTMGENTEISWTHHTLNPWIGCHKVSDGCKHCYAESFVAGRMKLPVWGPTAERRVTSDTNWKQARTWDRKAKAAGEHHRVFCASLADVFEPRPDLDVHRRRLAALIDETPNLDWLLLTKRPEEMVRLGRLMGWDGRWPDNVWAGTTVENQKAANERVEHLLRVPARVRFLSCEPLLGPVNLTDLPCNIEPIPSRGNGWWDYFSALSGRGYDPQSQEWDEGPVPEFPSVDWVIVGGESGPGARPMQVEWARSLRDQCVAAGVAFHFKQWGGVNKKAAGRLLDGVLWDEFPEVSHG